MQAETKKKWIEELRSGQHRQGIGSFDAGGARCVVGVLIYLLGGKEILTKALRDDFYAVIGLPGDFARELYYLNDQKRLSFAELADIIERELPCESTSTAC